MADKDPSKINRAQNTKAPSETALLDEYKSCDELSKHIDKMVWQLATLVFPIALGGLTFFGISTTHSIDQLLILVIVGIGSISLLLTWYFLSNQWADYLKLTYYRMREIESELNLWHYRYAYYIGQTKTQRSQIVEKIGGKKDKERYFLLDNFFGKYRHFGYGRARRIITVLFIVGWVALIIREMIQIF